MLKNKNTITIFTKEHCPHCEEAKAILKDHEITFTEVSVEHNKINQLTSVLVSHSTTVPQIFVGSDYLGNKEALLRLQASGKLAKLTEIAKTQGITSLSLPDLSPQQLESQTQERRLSNILSVHDIPNNLNDNEETILFFYKKLFHFLPKTFEYLMNWREANELINTCIVLPVELGFPAKVIGMPLVSAVSHAASKEHGCTYCQIHTASTGGNISLQIAKKVREKDTINSPKNASMLNRFSHACLTFMAKHSPEGKAPPSNSIINWLATNYQLTPTEDLLTQIASQSSINNVDQELINQIIQLEASDGEDKIMATAQVASMFGFLNVFNDIMGMQVESGYYNQAQKVMNIDAGIHQPDSQIEENPQNLTKHYKKSKSFTSIIDNCNLQVNHDYEQYLSESLGLSPNWILSWPQHYRSCQALMYVKLFQDKTCHDITPELKHMLARVTALFADHEDLAALEAYIAWHQSDDKGLTLERIKSCYRVASDNSNHMSNAHFSKKEQIALKFAYLSAHVPLTLHANIVDELHENFSAEEIVHMSTIIAVSVSIQRWCAIMSPPIEETVTHFLQHHHLSLDTMDWKFSRPDKAA